MESRNYLGIYWGGDRATVVCVAAQGRDRKLLDCFCVSVAEADEKSPQLLADRIGQVCSERKVKFTEAAVALDCEAFMQHTIRSEFKDEKKIAATVRFDTEEALATDVSEVAVAFRIVSSDDGGSDLEVYTAQRSVLSDVLFSLQSNGIDPVIVEPDVHCLSRYLGMYETKDQSQGTRLLHALVSESSGYLVAPAGASGASMMRAFPVGPTQERRQLLTREILVTTALAATTSPIGRLRAFDPKANLTADELAAPTRLQPEACDLVQMAGCEPGDLGDCADPVHFALAYGAALALPEKEKGINFRNDHMPYLGTKVRMQKALKFLSIALALLLLAVGVYFHTQLLEVRRYRTALHGKFEPDYLAVMPGEKALPKTMKSAVNDLERALRGLRAETTGIGAGDSISARMVQVLQAVNSCAAQTDLNIDKITITSRSILINADTSRRPNTLSVFDALKKVGLEVQDHRLGSEGGRDSFSVTLEPKKQVARKDSP